MISHRAPLHAIAAAMVSAAFWSWLAADPWIAAIQLGPWVVAACIPGALRVRMGDLRVVWLLTFMIGGCLAAMSLRFHPVR
jgi:hypothetical protein